MTPPKESATVDGPTLGPWPINAEPFWRHGGKRFVVIMWWLAVSITLMMGTVGGSLPRSIEVAMVYLMMAFLVVPGGAALSLWGLAGRAQNEGTRERLGSLAWKSVSVLLVLLMAGVTGMIVVSVSFKGWALPPLGVGIAFGFIVALGAIFGTLGLWAWLLSSKRFEIGRDWLLPTSYGTVRHKGRRVPFADIAEGALYIAEPRPTRKGPLRFYWRFQAGALGDCDVDGDVLEEAKLSEGDRGAVLERLIQINAGRGGKTDALKDGTEEEQALAEAAMKAEAAQAEIPR